MKYELPRYEKTHYKYKDEYLYRIWCSDCINYVTIVEHVFEVWKDGNCKFKCRCGKWI